MADLDEMRKPEFGDEVTFEVEHTGEKPEGPTTISREGMQALGDQFTAFVGARIMSRLDQGISVEKVTVKIDVELDSGPNPLDGGRRGGSL